MTALALEGLTVGVTADRRADEQVQMLTQRGAAVLRGPVLRTAPLADDRPARRATLDLLRTPPDVVIANTALGIRSWWSLADGWGLTESLVAALGDSYIAARGPKVAGALLATGLDVSWRAPSSTLAEIVEHLVARGVADRRVALQLDGDLRGGGNATGVAAMLAEAGAEVVAVQTYQWGLPHDPQPALRLIGAVCNRRVDAVTFTAAPAVHNFMALARKAGLDDEIREAFDGPVLAMCVGPVCRRAAVDAQIGSAKEPSIARLGAMVKALVDDLQGRLRVVVVDGVEAEVHGARVSVGSVHVALSALERSVFEALARRPGAVVGRPALRDAGWSAGTDNRAVEATVGRLRRRLAPLGLTVEAVPRRGYRLAGGRCS